MIKYQGISRGILLKKYISFLLMLIVPSICFGASARYTQLVRLKKQKMEQLEKCMGTSKGLQIAGISTLGLTAAGVAGNIYEAKLIKDNEKTLEKKEATITEKTDELKKKGDNLTKAEADLENAKKNYDESHTLAQIVNGDAQDIQTISVEIGTQGVTHGYRPGQLPDDLKNKLATPLEDFSNKCKSLEGKEGIASVLVWENPNANNASDAYKNGTGVLYSLSKFVVMECKLVSCNTETHYRSGDECVEKEKTEPELATTTIQN
jgi:hypothetical protein